MLSLLLSGEDEQYQDQLRFFLQWTLKIEPKQKFIISLTNDILQIQVEHAKFVDYYYFRYNFYWTSAILLMRAKLGAKISFRFPKGK